MSQVPQIRLTPLLIASALVAALGGLLFGLDTAVIAGATRSLTTLFSLSPAMLGVTVSSALWGTILGALCGGYLGDRFGRRDSLRVMAVLYLISAIGSAAAPSLNVLIVARIVGGIGIGGSSVLGPLYIAEIAPARLRGFMVGFFQFNVVVGILLAYFSNYMIAARQLGPLEWRWQLGSPALPSLLFLALLFFIPRSPRWLIMQGRISEAEGILAQVGEPSPAAQAQRIAASVEAERRLSGERLFCRQHRRPIFLALTIAVFCQFSGINAVLYYLNDIFLAAGASKDSGGLQTIVIGVTNLVFTSIAMLLIDRFGRRILLLVGAVGMTGTLIGIAAIFATHQHQRLLLPLLIVYCGSFSCSLGAVVWVYMSEVFPTGVRAKGQTLGSATHWVVTALIAGIFPLLADRSGAYPFAFFAAMMALMFFVVLFFYPETRNVSLESLQTAMEAEDPPSLTTLTTTP